MKYLSLTLFLLIGLGINTFAQFFVYKNGVPVYIMTDQMPDYIELKSPETLTDLVNSNYISVPLKETCFWNTTFNWGEDEIVSPQNTFEVSARMDSAYFEGYYTSWGGNRSYLYGKEQDMSRDRMNHHTWSAAWMNINKCNIGLKYIEKTGAPDFDDKEVNCIKGQLLYFRAWWYQELMTFFGGMPYTEDRYDTTLPEETRMSFRECADKAAADFEAASELLPNKWDDYTDEFYNIRVTKATALAYAGKVMLWASSPLYEKGAMTGGVETYSYNKTYAQKAAEYLGQSLALIESGVAPYELANYYDPEDYDALYNHDRYSTGGTCFSDIFYTIRQGFKQPGTVEAMMRGSVGAQNNDARWSFATTWGSNVEALFNGASTQVPTANYVNYAYGMANGLPLDDPDSGFDPTHPFKNRDPRFYHDIVFDGEKYINGTVHQPFEDQEYASLATNGVMRDVERGSQTGYFCQKLVPHTANCEDKVADDWAMGLKCYLPYLRVADVYLMYAEACGAVGGATAKSSSFSRTAEDAINTLRDRVGAGHVAAKYTADRKLFIDEVRRERACELAFEGFRLNDLQRWLLVTESPYTIKTSQEFERVESDSWYKTNDPREAEVKNWRQEVILTRELDEKHYLLPLPANCVTDKLTQNPGWEYLKDETKKEEEE